MRAGFPDMGSFRGAWVVIGQIMDVDYSGEEFLEIVGSQGSDLAVDGFGGGAVHSAWLRLLAALRFDDKARVRGPFDDAHFFCLSP